MQTRARTSNARHTSTIDTMAENNENNTELSPAFINKLSENAQARITTKLSGTQNYHKFMLNVNFAIETYYDEVKSFDANYIMDDATKCKFAYNGFAAAPQAWFTIAAMANKALMRNWNTLQATLKEKYDDKNREYNAYVEWRELQMQDSLDDYEARFDRLLNEKAVQPAPADQVMHYLSGLQNNLRTQVMSTCVRDKAAYTLEAAKSQARVFYTAGRMQGDYQKKPNMKTKVQFKISTPPFEIHPRGYNQMDKGPGFNLAENMPFPADAFLKKHNVIRSKRDPAFFPTTLRGPLSRNEGDPGHMLREFLGANNLCNFCRQEGHRHDECPQNPSSRVYRNRAGN